MNWPAQAFGARSGAMLADVTNRGAAEGTPARTPAAGKQAAAPHRTPASAAFANRPQAQHTHMLCLNGLWKHPDLIEALHDAFVLSCNSLCACAACASLACCHNLRQPAYGWSPVAS